MIELNDKDKWLLWKTIIDNPYIKSEPSDKQIEALISPSKEMMFGGQVGGGKSELLLMIALQYVESSNYASIIFRKTYQDLSKPGALIPRSHEWLSGTDAKWNGAEKRWTFPSGALMVFGHMDHEQTKYNYQGGEYNAVCFDELTHFSETQYLYMFSRLRSADDSVIPNRIRSSSNPDGVGLEWVKRRFVNPGNPERPYIPSGLEDNPHLNTKDYEESLKELDAVTFQRLRHGDWDAKREGAFFKTSQIKVVDEWPEGNCFDIVRRWDLAATEADGHNDPDFTVGVKMALAEDAIWILDIVRGQWSSGDTDKRIKQTAMMDGKRVRITAEQEPGSSGKRNIVHLSNMLIGFSFAGLPTTGNKEVNARPFASWVNQGRVNVLSGTWNQALFDEMALFPIGNHDDQVDACSHGFSDLSKIPFDVPFTSEGFAFEQEQQTDIW